MRALLTTASLALLISAAPANAQQKPDTGHKKPAHSTPSASATTPSAAAPAAAAPAPKPAKGKKHHKKTPAEPKPSN